MTNADNPEYTIPAPAADIPDIPENIHVPEDAGGMRFQNLKLLGMGGMGVVYEADDPALERKVALKMLRAPYRSDRSHIARFIKEARITAKIDHPNIIAVHNLGMDKDCGAYFSMRRIKGETLQSILHKLRENDPAAVRQYSLRRLLDIFVAACNGVAAAHQHGICHCDLKPSNIMVGIRGEVWVLDWGVAREKSGAAPDLPQNVVEGTPAFMAPELLCGQLHTPDEKSDVYALGTILYCILTWREAPFDLTAEKSELLKAAAAGRYLPLRAPGREQVLQVELAAVCRKMMALDRNSRYPDVAAVLADLNNYLDGMPVSAYSPGFFYRFLKFCRRRPLIPATVTVAAVTVAMYHMAVKYMSYADDCSRLRQAEYNVRQAFEHSWDALRHWNTLTSPESGIAPLQTALNDRNMLLSANLAMLEAFAAFDAAAGASPGAAESFAVNGGVKTVKQLLRLQSLTAPADVPRSTVERFQRRWQSLFDKALKSDAEFMRQVQMLNNGCGKLSISGESPASLHRCTLIRQDGVSVPMVFREKQMLELPSGGNYLHFSRTDGSAFAAFFQVNPGGMIRFVIPEVKLNPGFILIPADHWFAEIPGVGKQLKRLPAFAIAASEVSASDFNRIMAPEPYREISGRAVFSASAAEAYCKRAGQKLKITLRLPSELELRKSLTPGNLPGESFYGAKVLLKSVPLFIRRHNGSIGIFDPATMKTTGVKSGDTAALRAVAELK